MEPTQGGYVVPIFAEIKGFRGRRVRRTTKNNRGTRGSITIVLWFAFVICYKK